MSSREIYMRFLTLLHTLEGQDDRPAMDPDARRLLEVIALRAEEKRPLTVTEAMNLSHIASPATVHRKLDQLREIGMIETLFEGNNRRTKYLMPTRAALDYFTSISQVLQEALKTG